MIKIYPAFLFFFLPGAIANGQYCTAVGSTTGVDSNMESFNLAGESGTSITYSAICPAGIGLNDQASAETVTLGAGLNYNAFVDFGTCGGNYAGVGEGWIDYNKNFVFEPSESIGTWSGTPPMGPMVWNFTVPPGALTGTTRMRVVQYEGGWLPIDPCAQFSWGSTVDFTVVITGGMDCSAYVGENMNDPRIISALPFSESHNSSVCYSNEQTAYNSPDVFYRILPEQLGVDFLNISLCGSSFDTFLSILDADGDVIWYNDDDGSCGTGSAIIIPASGTDTLYIVVQGWGLASGDYDISVNPQATGIDDEEATSFTLYPNPAHTQFVIDTKYQVKNVTIYDLSGKAVLFVTDPGNDPINITGLAAGTYIVKLNTFAGESNQKLVVR